MSRAIRFAGLAAAALIAYVIAEVCKADTEATLAVLAAGISIGEMVMLRPAGRAPLPLSFAVFTVLVRAASAPQFIVVVVAGELVAALIRPGEQIIDLLPADGHPWTTALRPRRES